MAQNTFKVRASRKGYGGVPPARRAVGEVFRVAANKHGKYPAAKWYERVSDAAPEAKPERQAEQAQQYEKRGGNIVPVDRRSSADAFASVDPDRSYLDKVPALNDGDGDGSGEPKQDADSGDDLT